MDLPTDRLVEGLTSVFNAIQAEQAEKQQQSAAATTQAGNVVFSQTSIRMPAVLDGRGPTAQGVDLY